MRFGLLGRLDHIVFGRIRVAIKDVVAGRAIEHRRFLRDHPDLATQTILADTGDIGTTDPDRAAFHIVQPQKDRHHRRLACA